MSRIGKIPIPLPKNVKLAREDGAIRLEGPKGKLTLRLPQTIELEEKEGQILLTRLAESKQARSDHGTTHAHLRNMIAGVTEGHKRELEIQGVGFRAQLQGNKLAINLGFSHPVEYEIPKDIKVEVPKPTSITLEGMDKAMVGQTAARIRGLKPPEPYKGKGIRYVNEYVKRKQGKSVIK